MSRTKSTIPPERVEQYRKLVQSLKGVEVKGATMPYTSLNGHMFSFLDKDGVLALRLPAELREAFMKKYKTSLVEAHGTVLKEYVSVPESVFCQPATLKRHLAESLEYVAALKPKPAKK